MAKTHRIVALLLISLAFHVSTAASAQASDPTIEGRVKGIELCPQFICGRAIFVGSFQGRVGGAPAFGSWLAAIEHDDLPPTGVTVDAGPGNWTLRVWVFKGFFPRRKSFAGTFGDNGTLTGLRGNFYRAIVPMEVESGGSGGIELDLLLNENFIPQPVTGTLTQPD